jgi:hypothetical protein
MRVPRNCQGRLAPEGIGAACIKRKTPSQIQLEVEYWTFCR